MANRKARREVGIAGNLVESEPGAKSARAELLPLSVYCIDGSRATINSYLSCDTLHSMR